MHNFKENGGSYIFSGVAVKQPAYAIVKYTVIMGQIKLCKGVRVAARPLDKTSIFVFAPSVITIINGYREESVPKKIRKNRNYRLKFKMLRAGGFVFPALFSPFLITQGEFCRIIGAVERKLCFLTR
jgi:hypothetical protein